MINFEKKVTCGAAQVPKCLHEGLYKSFHEASPPLHSLMPIGTFDAMSMIILSHNATFVKKKASLSTRFLFYWLVVFRLCTSNKNSCAANRSIVFCCINSVKCDADLCTVLCCINYTVFIVSIKEHSKVKLINC